MSKKTQTTNRQDRTAKAKPAKQKKSTNPYRVVSVQEQLNIYKDYFRTFGFQV